MVAKASPLGVEPFALRLYLWREPARIIRMTAFDDRQNAFENKFAHDAELQFNVAARRNRLTGLWAAGLLGHSGDAAEAYAKSIVASDLAEAGDDDVVAKLLADLAGTGTDEAAIRAALAANYAEARRQIMETM
jgi:hypothetical protein